MGFYVFTKRKKTAGRPSAPLPIEGEWSFGSGAVSGSVGDPTSDGEAEVFDTSSRSVVVKPAESLDFFEDVGAWEVLEQLVDEVDVDRDVKGVARQPFLEVSED